MKDHMVHNKNKRTTIISMKMGESSVLRNALVSSTLQHLGK